MSKGKGWTSWFRLWGSKRTKARRLDDFADYGTAFGLDMSLAAQAEASPAMPGGDAYQSDSGDRPRFSASA